MLARLASKAKHITEGISLAAEATSKSAGHQRYSLRGVLKGGTWLASTRVLSLFGNVILVAMVPRLLSPEEFGIWSVISSTTGVLAILSLGLGPALRNRLAVLKHDSTTPEEQNRIFLSVTWLLLVISAVCALVGLVTQTFFNYSGVFTIQDPLLSQSAGAYLLYSGLLVLVGLPFALPSDITYAYHRFQFAAIFQIASSILPQLIGLAAAFVSTNKLLTFITVVFMTKFMVNIGLTGYFVFTQEWKIYRVAWQTAWHEIQMLISPALRFWILNFAWLLLFTTDTLIVNKVMSTTIAGQYNLVLKVFFTVVTLYSVLVAPLWNFYTDAATAGDWNWIRSALWKATSISLLGIVVLSGFLIPITKPLVQVWSGVRLEFGMEVIAACALWAIAFIWVQSFGMFLNGLNETRYQTIAMTFGAVINIPLTIYMLQIWGVAGAPLATVISLLPMILVGPIHSVVILRRNLGQGGTA